MAHWWPRWIVTSLLQIFSNILSYHCEDAEDFVELDENIFFPRCVSCELPKMKKVERRQKLKPESIYKFQN